MSERYERFIANRRRRGRGGSQSDQLEKLLASLRGPEAAPKDLKFDSLNPIGLILDVLDTPRSIVTSGAKEIVDAFQGDGFSPSDFARQYREGYGTGDLLRETTDGGTGNKWVDRGIGFVGDVLLDPLTYLGAPGASSLARGGAKSAASQAASDMTGSAARLGAARGDDVARRFSDDLAQTRKQVDEVSGKDVLFGPSQSRAAQRRLDELEDAAQTYLRENGYLDDIEAGVTAMFNPGKAAGASAILKDDVANVILGEGASGLRLRPFWKSHGGIQIMSQERWSKLTLPARSLRASIGASGPVSKLTNRFYSEQTRSIANLLKTISQDTPAVRANAIALSNELPLISSKTAGDSSKLLTRVVVLSNKLKDNDGARIGLREVIEAGDEAEVAAAPQLAALKNAGVTDEEIADVRRWFQDVRQWATSEGIEVGDLGETFFPIRRTREAILDGFRQSGKGGKAAFQQRRSTPQRFMGEDVPILKKYVEDNPSSLLPNGEVDLPAGWTGWSQWRSQMEAIGKRQLGDNWVDIFENDSIALMRRYLNEVTAKVQERRILNAAKKRGLGFLVEDYNDAMALDELIAKLGAKGKQLEKHIQILAAAGEYETQLMARLRAGGLVDPDVDDVLAGARAIVRSRGDAVAAIEKEIAVLRKANTGQSNVLAEQMERILVRYRQRGSALQSMVNRFNRMADEVADGATPSVNPLDDADTSAFFGDMAAGADERAGRLLGELNDVTRLDAAKAKTDVKQLEDARRAMEKRFDTQLRPLRRRLKSLKSQQSKVTAQVKTLRERQAAAKTIANAEARLDEIGVDIGRLNDEIASIGAERDARVAELVAERDAARVALDKLDQQIPKAEQKLGAATKKRRATLKERRELEKQIAELEGAADDTYRMSHQPSADGAPGHVLNEMVENFYDRPHIYGTGDKTSDSESLQVLMRIRGNPDAEVTIYRAAPAGAEMRDGDWVSLSKNYATEHGYGATEADDLPVLSKRVKASEIRWPGDSINEFGYFPSTTPVDDGIATIQAQLDQLDPADVKPLKARLAKLTAKRDDLEGRLGGRVDGTRTGGIDKDLKNTRVSASRRIAGRENELTGLFDEAADVQETAAQAADTLGRRDPAKVDEMLDRALGRSDEVSAEIADTRRQVQNTTSARSKERRQHEYHQSELGHFADMIADERSIAKRVTASNRPQLETLRKAFADMPNPNTKAARLLEEQIVLRETVEQLEVERAQLVGGIAAEFQDRSNALFDVLVNGAAAEADAIRLTRTRSRIANKEEFIAGLERQQEAMRKGVEIATKNREVIDNLTYSAGIKLRDHAGFMVPEELAEALVAMTKFQELPEFVKYVDRFTNFWKGWATASPGFHVRNAYSATFMNWVAGVPMQTQLRYSREYQRFARNLPAQDKEVREFIEQAMDYGITQRGLYDIEVAGKKSKPVEFSRDLGRHVENTVRGALAFHVSKTTAGPLDARMGAGLAAVNKFHFDYSDLSDTDQILKRVFPFYVWMARNIPLQLEMLATKPQPLLAGMRFYENLGDGIPENPFVPEWMKEQGFVGVGGSMFVRPELPYMDVIRLGNDWKDSINGLNPLIQQTVEQATGRDMWRGYEFEDNTARAIRFGESFMPAFSRARRLLPIEDKYQERWLSSVAGFLGVPVRELTESEMLRELRGQQIAERKAPPKNARERREREERKRQYEERQRQELRDVLRRAGVAA
jgi:hypothetical protein